MASRLCPFVKAQKATVRVRLWGPTRLLDFAAKKILIQAHHVVGVTSNQRGPIMLPTRIRRVTVQTSPHVDKAAREQWEYQLHSRFLSVNAETEDLAHDFFNLIERGLPPGIAMRAHITTFFDSTELYDAPEETVQFNMDNLKEEIAALGQESSPQ